MRKETQGGFSICSDGTEGCGSSENADVQVSTDEVRREWRLLWRDRIDDRVRAEGVASRDYSLLFIEQGLVIIATRDFKPLNLVEIMGLHQTQNFERVIPPHPSVGGWKKFARTVLNRQRRARKWKESQPRRNSEKNLQLKKGGRGWLHNRMKR